MKKKIGFIGGDLRNIRLAEILDKEGYLIYTYAIDKYSYFNENIIKCYSIENLLDECEYIISAIPFTKDGIYLYTPFSDKKIEIKSLIEIICNKHLIAGSINEDIKKSAINKNI